VFLRNNLNGMLVNEKAKANLQAIEFIENGQQHD
jgi:hypothetical protein